MRTPSEWALAGLTLATIAGFGRLFTEGWFWPLAVVAVAAHVVAGLCRHRGLGVATSALVSLGALAVVVTPTFFWAESTLGLPGPAAWDALGASLSDAWTLFSDVVAPTEPATGFLVATALAVSVSAFLADWAAFRLWSPYEAMVPATTLFVFAAMLGKGDHVVSAVLFLAAALLFLLLHRTERLDAGSWVGEPAEGRTAVVGAGALAAALALAAGALVGPAIPGADSPAVLDVGGRGGESSRRVTISPLVDIQQRLVNQSDEVVFTVDAEQPEYWRLTALDIFDGTIWRSGGKYQEAGSELPEAAPGSRAVRTTVRQDFEIDALAALWLPAAYEPRFVDPTDGIRYQAESGTLIVDSGVETSDGYRYAVESAVPAFFPDELRGAPAASDEVLERYAATPDGLSSRASTLARDATAGATTDYDRALLLQEHFRSYRYDLAVPAGHGSSAIDTFLDARAGYCEQFAGTFAAMARDLGMPARVAVGFTPGEEQEPGRFVVRGRHAHAWPEVWFEGFGWVAFEPTPGRGMPGAFEWTGLTPSQDEIDASQSTGTTSAPSTTPDAPPTTAGAPFSDLETSPAPSAASEPEASEGPSGPGLVLAVLALAGLVYAIAVPALQVLQRRRRRALASEPDDRVRLAWDEAVESIDGYRRPDETYLEFAARAGDRFPTHSDDLRVLADVVTAADYWTVDGDEAARAERASATVTTVERERLSTSARLGHALDVRRLWSRQSSRRKRSRTRSPVDPK